MNPLRFPYFDIDFIETPPYFDTSEKTITKRELNELNEIEILDWCLIIEGNHSISHYCDWKDYAATL